jgi:hypothetical protein
MGTSWFFGDFLCRRNPVPWHGMFIPFVAHHVRRPQKLEPSLPATNADHDVTRCVPQLSYALCCRSPFRRPSFHDQSPCLIENVAASVSLSMPLSKPNSFCFHRKGPSPRLSSIPPPEQKFGMVAVDDAWGIGLWLGGMS